MNSLAEIVPFRVLHNLSASEREYLEVTFARFNGFPDLEQMWFLLDEPWIELGCDPLVIDERIGMYYQHPVWVLNGLFIDQHVQSLENRRHFTQWVVAQEPKRVADFGGGFGGLARLIGIALPNAVVEVVEPYPHPSAIALSADIPNVRFVQSLTDSYDLLIATDVFEHVSDPIGLAFKTAQYLNIGGQFLIANCFAPVIRCHLPQLFHLQISWDFIMKAIGLVPGETVSYARAYRRQYLGNIKVAREIAECSQKFYPWISWLPRGKSRTGRILMSTFCR